MLLWAGVLGLVGRALRRGRTAEPASPREVLAGWERACTSGEEPPEVSAALELATLGAFLAPEPLPLDALPLGGDALPSGLQEAAADAAVLERAVTLLREGGLLAGTAFPREVQVQVAARLDAAELTRWVRRAVQAMDGLLTAAMESPGGWPVCDGLVPHALAAAEHARAHGTAEPEAVRLLGRTGFFLCHREKLVGARAVLIQALEMGEQALGPDHPEVAAIRYSLSQAMEGLGDWSGAAAQHERLLERAERAFGPDHPEVGSRLARLGAAREAMGDLTAACAAYERALSIAEAAWGAQDLRVAERLHDLAGVLVRLDRPVRAAQLHDRAVAIREAAQGADHPDLAAELVAMAQVVARLGDRDGAARRYEWALAILSEHLGPEHPRTREVAARLGQLRDRRAAGAKYRA